jgi:hypothetical protein
VVRLIRVRPVVPKAPPIGSPHDLEDERADVVRLDHAPVAADDDDPVLLHEGEAAGVR